MYQVIARKYRPQSFGELIGQGPVRTTIENAIRSNRLAHGYIFAGQRGTGKTTVARILARCLNCIEGPTVQPCGVCASCLEIAAGNSPDVIEIDAASNRGINEMRELRENVRYRPARDRYKVFIVDEAHQITNEAFNALLKTLEEPPEWAVFVLCTTEVHKIPNTIASRCQQFSFRSVDFAELVDRMAFIAKEEGIEADTETLAVIAQAGEGSVRDSLSALDQAIACCGNVLNVESVRSLLGMFGADSLRAVAEAALEENGGRMLEIVQELEQNGQDLQHYCRELARYWRNLLVAKIAGKTTSLISSSDKEQQVMLEVASKFSEEDLTRYLQLTLDLYKTLQSSLQPRFHMELGLIKLVQAGKLRSIEEALATLGNGAAAPLRASAPAPRSEIARLSTGFSKASILGTPPAPPAAIPAPPPASVPAPAPALATPAPAPLAPAPPAAPKPAAAAPPPSTRMTPPAPVAVELVPQAPVAVEVVPQAPEPLSPHTDEGTGDLKHDLFTALLENGLKMSADAVQHSLLKLQGSELVFTTGKRFMLGLRDTSVAKAASTLLGKPIKVRIEIDSAMSEAAIPSNESSGNMSNGVDSADEVTQRALAHPGVKRFQELFPGANIRSVRNLNE